MPGSISLLPVSRTRRYPEGMASSADSQRDEVDLNAGVDPEKRAAARVWARKALADARARFDPVARNELRARLGMPPAPLPER